MLESNVYPIVLAGGAGTRLWPVSRKHFPKQFLALINEQSLLQNTLQRLTYLPNSPIVICHETHRFLAAEQITSLGVKASIMLEPVAKNTAPAIALGAAHALSLNPEAILLVAPADHHIHNAQRFSLLSQQAFSLAQDGAMVLFGIKPLHAETGYGYIQPGEKINRAGEAHLIAHFIEKPDEESAKQYVASERFLWNSGIFCMRADVYLQLLERYQPLIYQCTKNAYAMAQRDVDFIRIDSAHYQNSPAISIDYGIMEKVIGQNVKAAVIVSDLEWSDLGSWLALRQLCAQDDNENVVQGDVLLKESENCYVRAEERVVAMLGMKNCIVIDTKDALLIAEQAHLHHLKEVVLHLSHHTRPEAIEHVVVHRPWGTYEAIAVAPRYQVKHITVKPGGRLSLQMHHHRAEHWVIVKGTAKVTRDHEQLFLHENQSIYIPQGMQHRLENPGMIPLELIEVQSGSYLGEDDIVRLDDVYQREQVLQ